MAEHRISHDTPLYRSERCYAMTAEQRAETLRRACQVIKEEFPEKAHLIVAAVVKINVI